MIDALQHGCAGDGTTDDSPALQALLDQGGPIYLPPGNYRLETGLVASNAAQVIVGAGPATQLICASGITAITLRPGNVESGGRLADFRILGQHKCGIKIDLAAVSGHIKWHNIEHIMVAQATDCALRLVNPEKTDGYFCSVIRRCFLIGGMHLERAGDSLAIEDNTISGVGDGIVIGWVPGAAMCRIVGNNVTTTGKGLECNASNGAIYLLVELNHFEKWQAGSINSVAQVRLAGSRILFRQNSVNPIASGRAVHALVVSDSDHCHLEHNIIRGNLPGMAAAVYVLGSASNTFISKHQAIYGAVVNQGAGTIHETQI